MITLARSIALLALGASCLGANTPQRPNILIILADDLGYADIGVHGCTDIPTPHIDSLAASGLRFTNGYSSHPFCSPMRAGLMACRYQHRFGYETNVPFDPQNPRVGLPVAETTIARRLRDVGYATGAIGKWHLGAAHVFHPNRRGFDFFYGFLGGGHDYFSVDAHRPMGEGYFQPLNEGNQPVVFEGYLTDALSRKAVEFVRQTRQSNPNRPFFLYLAYNAPHTPMQAPQAYLDRFSGIEDKKRRAYAAMVSAMDDGIGEVLTALDRHGIRDQTLVFFLSDNGGPTQSNGSRNDPLRGFKGDVWEGGIRVPFIVSWPGVLPEGRTYGAPVISLDVSRTALAVGGADPGKDAKLDGVNLIPFLTGRPGVPHDALFWRKDDGIAWAVRTGDRKLVKPKNAASPFLYDLTADIGESTNLSVESDADVAAMRNRYDSWNRWNQPPRFLGFRDYHKQKNAFYQTLERGE